MTSTNVSFEFFPPRDETGVLRLNRTADELSHLSPSFVSVTYGAGGTTRELTHAAVRDMSIRTPNRVAAHLTCVGATKSETKAVVDDYVKAGVTSVVALRGDPPKGQGGFSPHKDGYASSVELISALADRGDLRIICGAYPEPHPDGQGTASDVAWLKRKQDAGAQAAITQFFFRADTFLRFRDDCVKAGVHIPILPGILSFTSWEGAVRFAGRCGAHVPETLIHQFSRIKDASDERRVSVQFNTRLCEVLLREGVDHLHFYTLNDPHVTREVYGSLGIGDTLQKCA